jgi:non-specific serine/threonine protein kinase
VTVLVTSREPLHLRSEHEYLVLPLRESDAVSLFHERARAIGVEVPPDGNVVAICSRLDHLPLAIELAAARVKVLSSSALLNRLEERLPLLSCGAQDLPARQQTLRSTLDWSYELLTKEEQDLFARLAVFAGAWTLDAAESVCDASLDALQSLLEKSLLRRSNDRYWMLETIREYAWASSSRPTSATRSGFDTCSSSPRSQKKPTKSSRLRRKRSGSSGSAQISTMRALRSLGSRG